ncbi:MAG: alpha/beta hydrolase [Patescibacteria group bacterium]|nr:alpha/beta hydrolase [Patescibacteria group bacterium]
MKKRVFIVHGWDGHPNTGWFPWLKKELEIIGFDVFIPQLPHTAEPRINNWVPKLKEVVGEADEQTYFIGHSMGCQAIARYLEKLPERVKVGGAVFVAGFFKSLSNLEDEDIVRSVAKEWLEAPLDFSKVKNCLKRSVAIFSDDDHFVPLENKEEFINLGSKIIIEHKQGHFNESLGFKKLPIALDSLIEITKD